MHRSYRTYYFAKNVALIVADYYFSFRKLETGSPEEIEMEHTVNLRSANRLYNMCEYEFFLVVYHSHLGGYFAKFGQMASTMGNGIPEEYVQVLSKCQVFYISYFIMK